MENFSVEMIRFLSSLFSQEKALNFELGKKQNRIGWIEIAKESQFIFSKKLNFLRGANIHLVTKEW